MTGQATTRMRIRPELVRGQQMIEDAARYYRLVELAQELEQQIEAEGTRRGSRRRLALNRSLGYARRALRLLRPLAGIPEDVRP